MTYNEKMAIEVYEELLKKGELSAIRGEVSEPILRTDDVLKNILPLPPEAFFIGLCDDNKPVLLNLFDPFPSSLLVIGDEGAGKTRLLKSMAYANSKFHNSRELQFAVITRHPEEWNDLLNIENNVGIFTSYGTGTGDLVLSLASWAHGNKRENQSVILLIDDIAEFYRTADFDTRQNLRWLLLRGAAKRTWTIATIRASEVLENAELVGAMKTRVTGKVKNKEILNSVFHNPDAMKLVSLSPYSFLMTKGEGYIKFYGTDI